MSNDVQSREFSLGTIRKTIKPDKTPNRGIYFWGVISLIVAIVWIIIASFFNVKSVLILPITTITGVSIYAVIYLIAQVDERLVELFSNLPIFGGRDKDCKDEKDKSNCEAQKSARAVSLWLLATAIGMILCFHTTGLFTLVGMKFNLTEAWAMYPDVILSGILIGSGTKPLHDVINYFDKNSDSTKKST